MYVPHENSEDMSARVEQVQVKILRIQPKVKKYVFQGEECSINGMEMLYDTKSNSGKWFQNCKNHFLADTELSPTSAKDFYEFLVAKHEDDGRVTIIGTKIINGQINDSYLEECYNLYCSIHMGAQNYHIKDSIEFINGNGVRSERINYRETPAQLWDTLVEIQRMFLKEKQYVVSYGAEEVELTVEARDTYIKMEGWKKTAFLWENFTRGTNFRPSNARMMFIESMDLPKLRKLNQLTRKSRLRGDHVKKVVEMRQYLMDVHRYVDAPYDREY